MTGARLKHYGWGREGEGMSAEERSLCSANRVKFATDEFDTIAVPGLDDLSLREPRVVPPASVAPFARPTAMIASRTPTAKYPDYVRAMLGDYNYAPDVVAYPRNEAEISAVMDWAGWCQRLADAVRGRVERLRRRRAARLMGFRYKAAVTLDLRNLGKVVEVDQISRAALIEGGAYGPSLENQLKPHGVTLRHFPQSFEYSTLGGWIATRSGGHFASLLTRI